MKLESDTLKTVIFLAVIGAGAAFTTGHLLFVDRMAVARAMSWENLLDGAASHVIDKSIIQSMPRSAWLNAVVDGVLYKASGDAGPEVRSGCEGWLYLAEEIREVSNGERFAADRIRLAKRVASDLERRRVKLVVLAVPDKFAMARDYRCGLRAARQINSRVDAWKQIASSPELSAVDLTTGWPVPGFWRTDSHWDRTGARFAADKTASIVNDTVGRGQQAVRLVTEGSTHERPGDLMRLANLDRTAAWFGPRPDLERNETASIARTGGLLDEPAPALVILAGSSFSLTSGFLDYLEVALSREVAQQSKPGSGFSGAVLELLGEHSANLGQAKVVIWEWPMRSLTQPLTEAETAYLARGGE
jgi:alginate O-acetyltransferase complex protein AlgJ